MSRLVVFLLVLVHVGCWARQFSESCDFDNAELKKLCRKVESQEQYLAKMVDSFYKSDTVFRWYNSNKDWLNHPRLGRMIKRLLRRVSGESTSLSESSADTTDIAASEPSANGGDSDAKLQQIARTIETLELLFNQTSTKVNAVKESTTSFASKSDLVDLMSKLNSSVEFNLAQLATQLVQTSMAAANLNQSALDQKLKITELESRLNSTGQCSCSAAASPQNQTNNGGTDLSSKVQSLETDLQSTRTQFETAAKNIEEKLLATSDDLMKTMHVAKVANEETMRNFSQNFDKIVSSLNSLFTERYAESAGSSTYDLIINMSTVFNEDMQMVRALLSNSSRDVQFLLNQDTKVNRGIEELKTASRRHEGNIQTINNQMNEFRNHVQDQMASIRNSFIQSVNEFYNKLVERQNHMSYRLSSVIDDIQSIKTKVRITGSNSETQPISVEDEETPILPQFNLSVN